jgi:hypothetical protein
VPAGLFEVAFGIWLIAKGFSSIISIPRRALAGASQLAATSMAPAR